MKSISILCMFLFIISSYTSGVAQGLLKPIKLELGLGLNSSYIARDTPLFGTELYHTQSIYPDLRFQLGITTPLLQITYDHFLNAFDRNANYQRKNELTTALNFVTLANPELSRSLFLGPIVAPLRKPEHMWFGLKCGFESVSIILEHHIWRNPSGTAREIGYAVSIMYSTPITFKRKKQ